MTRHAPALLDLGEIPPQDADDANIPVDIWLQEVDEEDVESPGQLRDGGAEVGWWRLTADNYMPRKGRCSGEWTYCVVSPSRETLAALVREHWLPLYRQAVATLEGIANGTDDHLYYWWDNRKHEL